MTNSAPATASTDVAKTQNVRSALTDAALADMTDFNSAMEIMQAAGIAVEQISDYGTGFTVVDKEKVVGVPFIIAEWRFNSGDFTADDGTKREFVSAAIITKDGGKYVINDGGTGICEQLRGVTNQRAAKSHQTPQNGLYVPQGLTVSRYNWTDDKGHEQPGTTYYLSEAAQN